MKSKTTDSLKPPLMKRPSEVGYWKLNEMPVSETMVNKQSQKGRRVYQIDEITYTKGGLL